MFPSSAARVPSLADGCFVEVEVVVAGSVALPLQTQRLRMC
jgi:hypothetical protein